MGPRGVVRLVDVAERAGVTVSTASRALARPEMVRPATRARVEAAARALNYVPNRAARSLITGSTSTIAIVVPDFANGYFALVCRAAQEAAHARGYEVLIADTGQNPARESEIVRATSRWVDGLIVCAAQRAHRAGIGAVPLVYVNRRVRGSHAVLLDQPAIVELQLGHLLGLGHRRIVWVDGPKEYWASEVRRRRAQRVAAHHPVRITQPTEPTFDGGVELVDHLEAGATAVAAFNDAQAAGILARCTERGLRVPGDLSVIGSDDRPLASMVTPPLTTVRAPVEAVGRSAVSLLLDHLSEEGPVIVETLACELVVRGSTGPVPVGEEPES